MAYLVFANRKALFKNYVEPEEIEPVVLEKADATLKSAVEKFNQQFKD